MFEGQVETSDRINLLYDETTRHYHEIGNLTGAMAKKFVCKTCGKGCERGAMHTCDQTRSDYMASHPYVQAGVRIPCAECNRHFRGQSCFANYKLKHGNKKSVCDRKLEGKNHWVDQDVDGRIILRWIFRNWEGVVGTG
jgi:hypothetical protein